MLRTFIVILFVLVCLLLPLQAASLVYGTLDQFIASSDLIALVLVGEGKLDFPSAKSTSGRQTQAKIIRVFKGEAGEEILIRHSISLDDSLFQQGAGQYLVFLRCDKDLFIPTKGWPSSKPLRGQDVLGWSDSHSWQESKPLDQVIPILGSDGSAR